MSKKFKKIKATHELRQWWWSSFLPRYYGTLISNLKNTKNLGETNAITSDKVRLSKDTTFKPLSKMDLNLRDQITSPSLANSNVTQSNPFIEGKKYEGAQVKTKALPYTGVAIATGVPFYAGWDESLRKFIVTNRLLTRRDAGLEIKNQIASGLSNDSQATRKTTEFSNSPIQGLNEGSFLYWQTDMPFNSYNIDQFISTNQSFYAPLGWRRFEFRHSILKSWYANMATKTKFSTNNDNCLSLEKPAELGAGLEAGKGSCILVNQSNLILNKNKMQKVLTNSLKMQNKKTFKKAIARRIKKRYKLLKQMPSQLMYTPTGPLLSEILPSHYISVFDQQYRFPRNRYLKRNLSKTIKKTALLSMLDSTNALPVGFSKNIRGQAQYNTKEFTLRKRVKPRRKYHRKRFIKKDGLIFPRRTKFTTTAVLDQDNLRWRPKEKTKQKRNATERAKAKSNKRVKTNPLRLRQLRRREFQQIIKPTQRYQPRNGGFTWPGDYLRLEVVEMPKLKAHVDTKVTSASSPASLPLRVLEEAGTEGAKKTSLKQKINVQPVGIMPRKYLIEKHNIVVLKKKLEKAHSSHRLTQAIKEYKLLTQNQL